MDDVQYYISYKGRDVNSFYHLLTHMHTTLHPKRCSVHIHSFSEYTNDCTCAWAFPSSQLRHHPTQEIPCLPEIRPGAPSLRSLGCCPQPGLRVCLPCWRPSLICHHNHRDWPMVSAQLIFIEINLTELYHLPVV